MTIMEIASHFSDLKRKRSPIFMAAGFFDGFHLGHRRVVSRAVTDSHRAGGKAWVLTFPSHPLKTIRPESAPPLITTPEQKLEMFRKAGVDGCLLVPFTKKLAGLAPGEFVHRITDHMPALRRIFVGQNWRFGRGGMGTPDVLAGVCADAGIRVIVVDSVKSRGEVISSTAIRRALARGDAAAAARLLGRNYSFRGVVVKGRTVGRRLGYPTANIRSFNEVIFPRGVYAVTAFPAGPGGGEETGGVLNYGVRPTFLKGKNNKPILELHMFDTRGDFYGREMDVHLLNRIRDEKAFSSPAVLKEQIAHDVLSARRAYENVAK